MVYETSLSDSKQVQVTQSMNSGHPAVDMQFKPREDSKLFFPEPGTVEVSANGAAGLDWTYGEHYQVLMDNGERYLMAHLRLGSRAVGEGAKVKKGDFAGYQGNSGNVSGETGLHLHLEYKGVNGARKDPAPLMGFPSAVGLYDISFTGGGGGEPEPQPESGNAEGESHGDTSGYSPYKTRVFVDTLKSVQPEKFAEMKKNAPLEWLGVSMGGRIRLYHSEIATENMAKALNEAPQSSIIF